VCTRAHGSAAYQHWCSGHCSSNLVESIATLIMRWHNHGPIAGFLCVVAMTQPADTWQLRLLTEAASPLCAWTDKAPTTCALSTTAIKTSGTFVELEEYARAFYVCFDPKRPFAQCNEPEAPATNAPQQSPSVPLQAQAAPVNSVHLCVSLLPLCT
jgi:hypothetical protein